ncbi:MAG: proline dehydrogenase family protein [Acidobacteriaceae bacterium]|nr:proline dehydrogenase family protein [Acidobacteriaceae bacterium]
MLRHLLLSLSRQPHLRRFFETSPAAHSLTTRFIAGQTLADGIAVSRQLAARGISTALDHLGENVATEAEAAAARRETLDALDAIGASVNPAPSPATVAIKLTQFGLDLGDELCLRHVDPLFARARALGTRVEVDMESTVYTGRTLAIVKQMHAAHGCVRAVLQAYLYRTEKDVAELNRLGVPIRLCKGAYREPVALAFPRKADVDASFVKLMETLLAEGTHPAIASHDERILRHALAFTRRRGLPPSRYEFQMLYGIRRDWQQRLVDDGQRLRLYVPYGQAWYPYFMRRLAERPANVLFVASNLLRA